MNVFASRTKLLSPSEVAECFGVPTARIYELVRRGGLRSVRIGRLIRIRPDEVDAFLTRGGDASLNEESGR